MLCGGAATVVTARTNPAGKPTAPASYLVLSRSGGGCPDYLVRCECRSSRSCHKGHPPRRAPGCKLGARFRRLGETNPGGDLPVAGCGVLARPDAIAPGWKAQ